LKAVVFAVVFLFSLGAQAALSTTTARGIPAGLGVAAGGGFLVLAIRRAQKR
jgi:hypothetical protein